MNESTTDFNKMKTHASKFFTNRLRIRTSILRNEPYEEVRYTSQKMPIFIKFYKCILGFKVTKKTE